MKSFEEKFDAFSREIYPNGWSFNAENGTRDAFVNKNSQIVVNEIPVSMVFIGDSITHGFETSAYFGKYGFIVNRGIGGETLAHMTTRFKEDCLDLKPRLAIVASGINDTGELWRIMNGGEVVTEEMKSTLLLQMEENYRKVIAQARQASIPVWLASVLPLGTSDFRSELILRINEVIKRICKEENVVYVDYHSKLTKADGITLQDVTFGDDLHPHVKGYNIMYGVLEELLKKYQFRG